MANVTSRFTKFEVPPHVFEAMQNLDVDRLSKCSDEEIRAVLPCLSRMSLIAPLDLSFECTQSKRMVFKILAGREIVNSVVGLLSVDFKDLERDVKNEQSLRYIRCFYFIYVCSCPYNVIYRLKIGSQTEDSVLIQLPSTGELPDFEKSEAISRLKLFLYELLALMTLVSEV